MKRIFFYILFCAFGVCLYAQKAETTTIFACANGAENRMARLYLEDAITKFQWKVDEQPIDKNGCFQLSAELSETKKAFIKIDFYHTYIYLQPGENYRIIYDSFDFRIDERINPQKLDMFLPYRFEQPDSNELNQLIWRFENMFDHFLVTHYFDGITRELYNNFSDRIRKTFEYSGHQYFNEYKTYALADMERIFNLTSPARLFSTYIEDKPILYNNTAFADFIKEYYSAYFPHQVRYNRNVFVDQINRANDLPAILDSLGRDTTLQNEKLREFVILLGLREMYHDYEFHRLSVLRLLQTIETTTKFPEHSALAYSIIRTLIRFEPGVNQANFKFMDPERKTLYDFSESSNYKYILFVNGLCESCDAEVSILQSIAEKFKDTVDFLVVNCDYEINRSLRNKPRNLQNITYLYFNKDFTTLENLGIFDYPIAVWLDPNNIIQSYYFQLPSRRLERTIRLLTTEK
jgi:thiol-disulfide isomerase/thioredoxin